MTHRTKKKLRVNLNYVFEPHFPLSFLRFWIFYILDKVFEKKNRSKRLGFCETAFRVRICSRNMSKLINFLSAGLKNFLSVTGHFFVCL